MKYNKKTQYLILLSGLVMVSLMIPGVAALPQTGHPYLLFHDISEVPGYQYRTVDPWKGWEAGIISGADASLSRNFSSNLSPYDSISYRSQFARDLGMAYQITKKPQYSLKAKEALLNMEAGTFGEAGSNAGVRAKSDKARALQGYSLAYDWIQPTLDPATDTLIRDKLATSADTVYKDLNDNGSTMNYVSFADHHGQAYPTMGIASAVLYDYTNPNNLSLTSTPSAWHRVGTEYLFENDLLHYSSGKSMFSFGFDEASGKYLNGGYKIYVMDDLALWFQISNHAYGENLLDKYPAAKKGFTSEIWESLPNQYSDNYVTNGNTKWVYHKAIVSLLPDNEKSMVLNHLDRIEKSTLLPYSSTQSGGFQGGISSALLYSVYGNYAAIPRTFPATTSHLDPNAITQVFRGSWNDDADWLSLITFNKNTGSNRDMPHPDQLSFEYYSRGDLLLADGGEDKTVLDRTYGTFTPSHNTIAIENPRTPFPVSPYVDGSSALGIYKGNAGGLVTPPTVDTIIQTPWVQALQAHVSITKLSSDTTIYSTQSLSSPIQYTRTILYPDTDYFIIVDRMEGTEAWTYRNIFRPTSLMITPTIDANKDGMLAESEVGHVNGDLSINTTLYNWQALPYKKQTATGITTNTISWATKNPYAKEVKLDIVSAPASEILVTKYVGRIAGYDSRSEVFNPVIYMKSQPSTSLYRVTALLSRYSTETAKNATEISVTGTGHAIKVSSASSDDYIYTGKGTSSFAGYTTDADTVYIRKQGNNREYTLMNGSFLKEANISRINITRKVDLLTLKQEGTLIKFKVKGTTSADIRMEQTLANSVVRDGAAYTQWTMENNSTTLKISTSLSEHDFEVSSVSRLSINPLSNQTVNASEHLTFPLKYTYTGSGTVQLTASSLPKYAEFNTTSGIFSWIPYANQTGNYTVTFNVTDGRLSDSKKVFISVTTVNRAPVLEQISNKTMNASTKIQFVVNATDPDGNVLSYSSSGLPGNATFNTSSRIFSWIPYANQTGNHIVTFNVTDGRLSDSKKVLITVNAVNRAPVLEQIGNKTVNASTKIQFVVNATDPDGDVLSFSSSGLPGNATFNTSSRIFSWIPYANQTGNHTVTFNVTDGRLSDSKKVFITVTTVNRAPVLEQIGNKTVNASTKIQFVVNATDPDGDVLSFSSSGLPGNATFNISSRIFSWIPYANQTGNYTVTFNVTDGRLSDSKKVLITVNAVNRAPILEQIGNKTVNASTKIQFVVNATDPDRDVLSFSSSGLPGNATFNTTSRIFSWIPYANQTGNHTATFNVTDGRLSDSKKVFITVITVNRAPILEQIGNKTVNTSTKIQFIANATDPDGDVLTYSASVLPANATFDPAGHTFSWTPVPGQSGSYTVNFSASDGKLQDVKSVRIVVNESNNVPAFGPMTNASVNQKETLKVQVSASDPDGDPLTYSASALPKGATFNPATREFKWSPAYYQIGKYTVTFRVSDGKMSASRDVTITAIKTNYAPYFTLGNVTTLTYNEGTRIQANINAADWNQDDVITYSATNLPKGATFYASTHYFAWTPGYDQAGTYTITLIASDGKLQSSKLLHIIVNDTPANVRPNTVYIKLE